MQTKAQHAAIIGSCLGTSEMLADTSIAEDARMIATIIEQFRAAGLSGEIDQTAIELAAQGMTLAIERRGTLRTLHGRLAAQARKHQLNPSAYGDTENPPKAAQGDPMPLRAVA